ncbi:MAG2-interacting protein [Actinidia chinensis var. chinensis]|uniref:MAG2-interacting protein n=1 Tax=Actinidia chinensis var. chinensis TaxID=1590841 RepID=A0A2R6Q9A4_ACTCC|nr:MAG2-interacting protein [Actinidia chinensis var. chinensis]
MEEGVREVLYETRSHASKSYSPNYPPQHQQLNEGFKGSLLSLLSSRGVNQLKEKWSGYRSPRKLRKWTSLFVSPRGEYVAVALGNQLTILQKDDDYQQACGFFTNGSLGTFTVGIWSEFHDVLGVADDASMLYFIKANGEEITRITKRILKVSSPIVGLIAPDGSDNKSCLCSFNVLTSDGSIHEVEISQDPSASIFSARTSNNGSTLKEFPENVFCLNYHPVASLLAVVGGAVSVPMTSSGSIGTYTLSIWRRTRNLDLEPVFSTQFEGLYSKPKGYVGQLTSPKALLSPEGNFFATLDLRGHIVIFKLDNELCSLSNVACGEKYDSRVASDMSTRGKESLNDITDFTWWSDHIIALAKRSGVVTMIDMFSGIKLLEKDPLYSMPVLESVQQFPGRLFLLESTTEYHDSSSENAASHLQQTDLVTEDKYNQLDIAKLHWSLLSFSKKSVSEMYDILITDQKYQVALDFANRHGLDKDEVLKSQWLHSARGINEIKMFLSVMKDQDFILSECVDRVGPTEEAVRALIAHGLHLTDQFSVQEYNKFRHMPINEAAVTLAESGKIGALNLLFKRHPYSLTPFMLEILAAIPETVPVQSYGQLLPGNSPPSSISLREKDWVECQDMLTFVSRPPENHESCILLRTEHITKQCLGSSWPSTAELSIWYKSRARDMDSLSGQLDNCLALVDFACRKGIYELQQFHEDISYLHQLIYSDGNGYEVNFTMSLVAWEQLSDFEKFKMMLKEVREESVVERLRKTAIPFMQNRFHIMTSISEDTVLDEHSTADWKADSFLVRWLKEIASENKLDICLKVIDEGCKDFQSNSIFRDNAETVDCSLQCIYMCNNTDEWSTMASILSKLPEVRGWDGSRSIATESETTANRGVQTQTDSSSRLTSTLVALKSSRLVRAISPSIEISPDDLLTVDSAVSCFLRLCGEATSEPHFDALLAILEEWEGLYMIKRDEADSAEAADDANDWGNDDWDEGWESCQEEPVSKETKNDDSISVHPLRECWLEIFKKLVALSRYRDLLKLIDQSMVKSNGFLLDQAGVHSLSQIVLGIDCFAALKVVLLFPYEAIQLQCLDAVEEKLKQGGTPDVVGKDHEFLILVLSSGLVSTIVSRSSYGTTFSLLCSTVGNFSRQYQEAQLSSIKHKGRHNHEHNENDFLFLFGRILFPCFLAELVKADQQILAGLLVTKFMHTNPSLSLINIAEASLRRFLERQLRAIQGDEATNQDANFGEPLVNSISQLRGRFPNLIQSALLSLSTYVR